MRQKITEGQTYKWLTVLGKTGEYHQNSPYWFCRCTCGRVIHVPEFALRDGSAGCCGPCVQTMIIARNGGDLNGRTVQGITIEHPTGEYKRNSPVYLCKCNHCGNEFETTLTKIRRGQVVACPDCARTLPPPPDLGIK